MSPRLGLLRGTAGISAGIWDSWWYFKGPSLYAGGDNGHLWMDTNPDFEFQDILANGSIRGSILVGAEPAEAEWNTHKRSALFTKAYYPSAVGSWMLSLQYNAAYPLLSPRRCNLHTWRPVWPAALGYAEDFAYPYEKTLYCGRFADNTDWSFEDIVDSTQQIHAYTFRSGNGITTSTSRIRIAGEGHTTGPDYSRYEYKGKIYWVLWISGYVPTGQDMYDIFDGTKQPNEIADSSVFPMCYINFKDPVGATLTPDVQSGPNAPYIFNVYGTPILNGP